MPPPGPAIGRLRRPVRIADGLFGDNYEKHPNSPCTSSCGHLPENSLCPRGLGGVHPGFVRARWQSWVRRARQGAGVFRSLRLSVLERQLIGANRRPARRFAPGGFCLPSASIAALLLQSLLRGESDVASGTVKWFNGQKGYGFIAPDGGGKDVFVHISAVEKAGLDGLPDGAKVTFDIVSNRGKESAENLRVK